MGAPVKEKLINLRNQIPKELYSIEGVGDVWVYGLTSLELEGWRRAVSDPKTMDQKLSAAYLLQLSLRDAESGLRLFGQTDIMSLAELPAAVVGPMERIVMRLSGYGDEALKAIAKNSQKIPGGDGSPASPESTSAP